MKAYAVFHRQAIEECVLVFAETVNKARSKAAMDSPYDWSFEYIDLYVERAPKWDKYAKEKCVIETNDDLPEGAPNFYNDSSF